MHLRYDVASVLDISSFRGADCDSGHYVVVAEVRERLAVSKRQCKNLIWGNSISRN
jgi:hypothetical protein